MTRAQDRAPSSIRTGDLVVDCVARRATVGGQYVRPEGAHPLAVRQIRSFMRAHRPATA
jgi:hypothetical protein